MVLRQIILYPIKSLDGVVVERARLTAGGILEHDRVYAIVDDAGAYVNGKRTARVHALRSEFDPEFREVCLWTNDDPTRHRFVLAEPAELNGWLSAFFEMPVKLICEAEKGFPDDRTAFGPTITSEASLQTVAGWFPGLEVENARRRFRSNLEIGGVPAFWEDHLFGAPNELKPFQIGEIGFFGHNPCQRCAVPVRDPDKGDPIANFQKSFMELRRRNLPAWSNADRFNHYYRFAINTSVPPSEAGKMVQVGDVIQVEGG
jgi:uncharacterized protein YcbX